MREITISEFNNINVYYNNEKIILPKDYSDEVEKLKRSEFKNETR